MKKILLILTFVLFAQTASAAGFECKSGKRPVNYVPIEKRYAQGLLFKVGRCGKAASFILGTVHSDHPKLREAVAFAEMIMQQSAAVGFEYIVPENAGELVQKYLFGDTAKRESLRDLLEAEDLQQTTKLLQRFTGMLPNTTRKIKPWAAAVMLQYPAPTGKGEVLDIQLQSLASEQHIPLFGVETMEEQFKVFDALPIPNQLAMLKETIASIDRIDQANAEMLAAYMKEDLHTITKISDREAAQIQDPILKKLFTEVLIKERNATMAKRLYPQLVKGQRFLAVGALHLLGRDGLLKRLEEMGYLIEPLSARTGDK